MSNEPPRARILALLPPEVLNRIFEFTANPDQIQGEAFSISAVCHDFQHVFKLYPLRHLSLKTEREILALSAKLISLEEAKASDPQNDEAELDGLDEIVRTFFGRVDAVE